MCVITNIKKVYDEEKDDFINKKTTQLLVLKTFMDGFCVQDDDGYYTYVRNDIDKDERAQQSFKNNYELIRKHFKYYNYFNLLNSPKKIRNIVNLMCKQLFIAIDVKVRNRNKEDGTRTTYRENKIYVK